MLTEDEVDFGAFVDAVASTEKKEAQDNSTKKGFDFPVCAQVGNKAIVRFVNGVAETALDRGKPGSGRAQLFNIAWVKDDAGKAFPLCLPPVLNNKSMYPSTMHDFINKVLGRAWVDNPDPSKKGSWKYFYAERDDRGALGDKVPGQLTLKDIFWNVFKSGHKEGEQYYETQKSWRGQTVYVANVIDRLDYEWHKTNKKTKLLMRSLKLKGDRINHKEVSFHTIGTPLKELTDNHGTKLDYDVLITPGSAAVDKFIMKNVSKLKEIGYWDDVKNVITDEDKKKISTLKGFTDEEKTWEPIDISKYYRFTPAGVILKHFGVTIKSFDDMVGTNFYGLLQEEAKADEAMKKVATAETPVEAPVPSPVEAPVAPAPVNQAPSFDTMTSAGAPEPMAPSAEAQGDIDTFYSSL